MLIIYRGIGVIVIVFAIVALVAAGWLQNTFHLTDHLRLAATAGIFALLCIVCGQLDEESSLFFIPIGVWGYLALFIPTVLYAAHVYEQKLDADAVKAELADYFLSSPSTANAAIVTTPPAEAEAAPAAPPSTAPAADPAPPPSADTEPAPLPVAAVAPAASADAGASPAPAPDTPSTSPDAQAAPADPQPPVFRWVPRSSVDPMNHAEKQWLEGTAQLPDGTAVDATMERVAFGIDVTITVDGDRGKHFVYQDDPADDSRSATSFRVGIDDAGAHVARATMPNSNIIDNEITVSFVDFGYLKSKLFGQNGGVSLGTSRAAQGVGRMLNALNAITLVQAYKMAEADAGGSLAQFAQAKGVVIELPLADHTDNFVGIRPREQPVADFVREWQQRLAADEPPARTANAPEAENQANPDWCPRAAKPAELLICDTPQLRIDENKMEGLYHALIANAGTSPDLKALIRTWIGARDSCASQYGELAKVLCIHKTYGQLIGQLEQLSR